MGFTGAHTCYDFDALFLHCISHFIDVLYWNTRQHTTYMVIFYKWYIQKWEIWIHYIASKSISRNERSQFIVENTSQWQKQSKAQDCLSRIVACWQILLTDKAFFFQQPSHPACVLVEGTQRFFLASVGKYCSVSQDVTQNELCK